MIDHIKTTKHTCGGPAFGRLTVGCPRCDELRAGAAPVRWNLSGEYGVRNGRVVELTREQAALRLSQAIRNHDCAKSRCGPVCTAFDW